MAHPTGQELRDAVALLAERLGYGKLHERLVRLNAFVSRRKPPSPEALADRLYALTGGLRRQVPATMAFHSVWSETFTRELGEDNDQQLEALAERINKTLTEDERGVRDAQRPELETALAEYERILAAAIGPAAARFDMLLKAVPPVADLLRSGPAAGAATTGAAAPATPAETSASAAPGGTPAATERGAAPGRDATDRASEKGKAGGRTRAKKPSSAGAARE